MDFEGARTITFDPADVAGLFVDPLVFTGCEELSPNPCPAPPPAFVPGDVALYTTPASRLAPDGAAKNGRVLAELKTDAQGGQDGLKTDESGNVWVAGPGGIWVFDSEGKHAGTVPLPETPSNCNWGPGFRNLFVTARTSVYRINAKVNGTRTY